MDLLFLLVFCAALLHTSQQLQFIYKSSGVGRVMKRRSVGHVMSVHKGHPLAIQCLTLCLSRHGCSGFNHNKALRRCELVSRGNNAVTSGGVSPTSLKPARGYVFYSLGWFEAEGLARKQIPASHLIKSKNSKCKNGGVELMVPGKTCVCNDMWTGETCDVKFEPAPTYTWTSWSQWQMCSASCRGHTATSTTTTSRGFTFRTRRCVSPTTGSDLQTSAMSRRCIGRHMDVKKCIPTCDTTNNAAAIQWSEWQSCSSYWTCGRGYMRRYSDRCHAHNGCVNQTKICVTYPTCNDPVRIIEESSTAKGILQIYNSYKKDWQFICGTGFSRISANVVCNQMGYKGVHKVSETPIGDLESFHYLPKGHSCVGFEQSLSRCIQVNLESCKSKVEISCSVKGQWSNWGPWSECPLCFETSADRIQRFRNRKCESPRPRPMTSGLNCSGVNEQWTPCTQATPCPTETIKFKLGEWSDWSVCSLTCGANGTRSRVRECQQILPNNTYSGGGEGCQGELSDTSPCVNFTQCIVFGEWSEWGKMESCSASCGGGLASRHRTCSSENCLGSSSDSGAEKCNDYKCEPLAESCSEWRNRGMEESQRAQINPLYDPIWVYCNMQDMDKIGITELGHDHEEVISLGPEEFKKGIELHISYILDNDQIDDIVSLAEYCRQYIGWACIDAPINKDRNGNGAWINWKNKDFVDSDYWARDRFSRNSCTCQDREDCASSSKACNCDMLDGQSRLDDGYVTNDLPINGVVMQPFDGHRGSANLTIGVIQCYGLNPLAGG